MLHIFHFSSVAQWCLNICDLMNCSMPGFPVHHQLPEITQTHVHWVGEAINHLILCRLLLLPSIFPSFRVFSNEPTIHIRWPKYQSFSFSISPSNEHPGQISFRMDWLDCLQSKGLSRVFSWEFKTINSSALRFFTVQISHPYNTTGKQPWLDGPLLAK